MNEAKLTNTGLLVLRLTVGLVMVMFGCQKLLGLFGGQGFNATIAWMGTIGIPQWLAALAIFAEFFGGLGLIFGLFTRFAAFGVMCTMVGALATKVKGGDLSLATAEVAQKTLQGLGFPLVILGAAAALLLIGGGQFSLDAKLFRKSRR